MFTVGAGAALVEIGEAVCVGGGAFTMTVVVVARPALVVVVVVVVSWKAASVSTWPYVSKTTRTSKSSLQLTVGSSV